MLASMYSSMWHGAGRHLTWTLTLIQRGHLRLCYLAADSICSLSDKAVEGWAFCQTMAITVVCQQACGSFAIAAAVTHVVYHAPTPGLAAMMPMLLLTSIQRKGIHGCPFSGHKR